MHVSRILLASVLTCLLATSAPAHASSGTEDELVVSLRTGQDADQDGFDDHWTVVVPGSTTPSPSPIAPTPFVGWRGNLNDTGPFNMGFRYPALGDGQWLGQFSGGGTFTFEMIFDLPTCEAPRLVGEWAADNRIEIFLNGMPTGVASDPAVAPPLPWLSNVDGPDNPFADPTTGLVTPTCEQPPFRCNQAADEFREIHPLLIDDVGLFNVGGSNVLTVLVENFGGPAGFLLTGGVDTATPEGAVVICQAAAPQVTDIPTVSEFGAAAFVALLVLTGLHLLRRH
ncbi:MAG: hypothetical protein AAGM22_32590 [Acidobacteriota bacterium]